MNPVTALASRSPASRRSLAGLLPTLLALCIVCAGCASGDRTRSGLFEPYRFSIPQGNYLNQQMLDQVRAGMSPEQVRMAIGTPLLTDPFHPDRWDYVFRFQYANGDAELRRVTVHFSNGAVSDIRHDPLPARDDPNDPALPGYEQRKEPTA